MHLSKPLMALTICPVLHASAYRSASLLTQADLLRTTCPVGPSFSCSRSLSSQAPGTTSSLGPSSYRYRIGASFSAKGKRFNPKTNLYSFEASQCELAKSKDPTQPMVVEYHTGRGVSGQDAFFVSQLGSTHNVAFGVADGVGGWVESGIDPAHFSHGLCQYMVDVASSASESEVCDLHASALLKEAYDRIVADDAVHGGGSTACIAVGRDNGTLEVAK